MKTITYKGWYIEHNPKPIPTSLHDYDVFHEDYDGAPDSGDHRCFTCASIAQAKSEIEHWISENELHHRKQKC